MRENASSVTPSIRPYRSADLDSLYAISLSTGHQGGDASSLYVDKRMVGHIYSAPYAIHEPDLCYVVEDGDGVCGFVLGTTDTRRFERCLEDAWWPDLRRRYPAPPAARRDVWTPDERRADLIHHPSRAPDEVVKDHPAHLHMNLLPRVQGKGLGAVLLDYWLGAVRSAGVRGVHVAVNRSNQRGARFWQGRGFSKLSLHDNGESGSSVWLGQRLGD